MMEKGDGERVIRKYNNVYLSIITRYKDYIEKNESLYVADLPSLIVPGNPAVLNAARKISDSFPNYSYDKDFIEASRLALSYVKDNIETISIPIRFWQKPWETIANGAGDAFDKAVLLCSILIAIGGESTRIMMALERDGKDFVVFTKYRDELFTLDEVRGLLPAFSKQEIKSRLVKTGEDEIFEFNDKLCIASE